MSHVSARRALVKAMRRRRGDAGQEQPPVFWGRIGDYEAVTRSGILFLLSPESTHPSRRVKSSA